MSKARDLARLSPNASGLLPNANIEAVAASKLTGQVADANAPSGSVIQVVTATKTDTFSWGGGTTFTAITGLSASITPISTSNKILIFGNVQISQGNTGSYGFNIAIYRNGSVITGATGDAGNGLPRSTTNTFTSYHYVTMPLPFCYLDSPASLSAQTYQIYGIAEPGGTVYVNRPGNTSSADGRTSNTISTITVMEIAA